MNCTKCGREVPEGTVFCSMCLDVMKQYPVKPGTSIQLPQRVPAAPRKAASKKKQSPEELVIRQRRTIRWLAVFLACTVLLLALSVTLLFHLLPEDTVSDTIGQNYITRESSPED